MEENNPQPEQKQEKLISTKEVALKALREIAADKTIDPDTRVRAAGLILSPGTSL